MIALAIILAWLSCGCMSYTAFFHEKGKTLDGAMLVTTLLMWPYIVAFYIWILVFDLVYGAKK